MDSYSSLCSYESFRSKINELNIPENQNVLFVKEEASWRCVHCDQIPSKSWQLSCGHRICETHFENIFGKDGYTCRSCNDITTKTEVIPDISGRKEISEALVFCTNGRCETKVKFHQLQNHLTKCKFSPAICKNSGKGCKAMLLEEEMKRHLENECLYEPVTCKHCRNGIIREKLRYHIEKDCPDVKVKCQHGCGIKEMKRCKMVEHEPKCTERKQNCTFYGPDGCSFQGKVLEVEQHEKKEIKYHLKLMNDQMKKIMSAFEQQLKDLMSKKDDFGDTIKSMIQLKEEKEAFRKEIKTNKKSIQELKLLLASQGEKNITLSRRVEDLAAISHLEPLKADTNKLKEECKQITEKITLLERAGPTGGNGPRNGLTDEVARRFEQQIAMFDTKLSELDLRFQLMETASYDGKLMWKIRDYSRRKQEAVNGRTLSLFSQPFYSSRNGYKMCGRIYLNGDGAGKGSHLSFFFVIMKGDFDSLLQWPFRQKVSLMLLSQDGSTQNICDTFAPDSTSNSFRRPQSEMNVASGIPTFITHQQLEKPAFLQDDTIYLMIKIDRDGLVDL